PVAKGRVRHRCGTLPAVGKVMNGTDRKDVLGCALGSEREVAAMRVAEARMGAIVVIHFIALVVVQLPGETTLIPRVARRPNGEVLWIQVTEGIEVIRLTVVTAKICIIEVGARVPGSTKPANTSAIGMV